MRLLNSIVDVCVVYGIDETSTRSLDVMEEGVSCLWGEGGGGGGGGGGGRLTLCEGEEGVSCLFHAYHQAQFTNVCNCYSDVLTTSEVSHLIKK